MKSKTLLITTAIITATTAAFGAASLRTPTKKISSDAIVTPTTARAGTLRAPTMKTSSVSTPTSVTTTQSIATPVSTETTDARIALLKGIKGFNPGKIKDTTAATNELNAIDSRIEELQSKLDQAEAAADQTAKLTDVYTKEQVEAKIDEKISAIGTSTSAKETYSKAEVDALLNDIKKKLPTFNDKGNMTWTDPNGNLVAVPYHWINLVNQNEHLLLNFVQGQGWNSTPIADIFTYQTNKTNDEIATFLSTHTCKGETSRWCIITNTTALDNGIKEIDVLRLRHGSWKISEFPEEYGYTYEDYWTFENSPKEYIKNMVCGNRPENECFVDQNSNYTYNTDVIGEYYNVPGQIQEAANVRIFRLTRYYMDLNGQTDFHIVSGQPNMGTSLYYTTNMSTNEIEEYVSTVPCRDETSGTGWCVIEQTYQATYGSVPYTFVIVNRFHHGYKQGSVDYITNNNTRVQNFVTIENNAENYILDQICGDRPSSECHLLPNHQTDCRSLSGYNSSRQVCDVYIEQSINN